MIEFARPRNSAEIRPGYFSGGAGRDAAGQGVAGQAGIFVRVQRLDPQQGAWGRRRARWIEATCWAKEQGRKSEGKAVGGWGDLSSTHRPYDLSNSRSFTPLRLPCENSADRCFFAR